MLGVVELGLVGLGTYVVFETKTACDRDQVDDSQLVKDLLQVQQCVWLAHAYQQSPPSSHATLPTRLLS